MYNISFDTCLLKKSHTMFFFQIYFGSKTYRWVQSTSYGKLRRFRSYVEQSYDKR